MGSNKDFFASRFDVRKERLLQLLREVSAFLPGLVHLAVTGSICTNKMDPAFVLGLVSPEETRGGR